MNFWIIYACKSNICKSMQKFALDKWILTNFPYLRQKKDDFYVPKLLKPFLGS